jgi:hypothetical protein
VPLLRRMINLKKLTLCLTVRKRAIFIDGNHLNEILIHMPRLDKFVFYIHASKIIRNGFQLQTTEEFQNSFNHNKWSGIKYWIDQFPNGTGVCNLFSLPFTMKHMDGITNSFSGGKFCSVHDLSIADARPFEHDFFDLIARAFPSLSKLVILNLTPQIRKQQHWQPHDDITKGNNSSIVTYPHLKYLRFYGVHIDYAEEFLHENNAYLPSLTQLQIAYEQLATITNNFTNNKTRINCVKLREIRFNEPVVYPKDFYLYFPSL